MSETDRKALADEIEQQVATLDNELTLSITDAPDSAWVEIGRLAYANAPTILAALRADAGAYEADPLEQIPDAKVGRQVVAEWLLYLRDNGQAPFSETSRRVLVGLIDECAGWSDAEEAMRERAAKACEGIERGLLRQAAAYRPPSAAPDEPLAYLCEQASTQLSQAAAAIRSLPLAPASETGRGS